MGPEDIAGVISFRFGDSHVYVIEVVCPAPELLLCARGFFSPACVSAVFGELSRSCGRLSLQVVSVCSESSSEDSAEDSEL